MSDGSTNVVADKSLGRRGAKPPRIRLRWIALLLFVTAGLFCFVVAWHRDSRMHYEAMEEMRQVRDWIQDSVDGNKHTHLPFELPETLTRRFGKPAIPYPDRHDLYRLSKHDGPYVLFAGPRCGLILPGGDGCPAIVVQVVENGRFRFLLEWMTLAEIDAARAERDRILSSNTPK